MAILVLGSGVAKRILGRCARIIIWRCAHRWASSQTQPMLHTKANRAHAIYQSKRCQNAG
eukprot:5037723-Amphidinium_carterae.1